MFYVVLVMDNLCLSVYNANFCIYRLTTLPDLICKLTCNEIMVCCWTDTKIDLLHMLGMQCSPWYTWLELGKMLYMSHQFYGSFYQ